MSVAEIHQLFVALYRPDTGARHVETVEEHLKRATYSRIHKIPPEYHVLGIFQDRRSATHLLNKLEDEIDVA
jgi:hypothetical protein